MTPTGVLLVTPIFRRGSGSLSLLQGPSRVALALHKARCGTPLGVTKLLLGAVPCQSCTPEARLFWCFFFSVLSFFRRVGWGKHDPGYLYLIATLSPPDFLAMLWGGTVVLLRIRTWSAGARKFQSAWTMRYAQLCILAEGAIALLVTLSGSALFAS